MAILVNRARVQTSTTGTGTITLGSAVSDAFFTFAEAGVQNGDVVSYVIEDGNDVEIGIGTYTSSGTTLSRDTVTISKIGGTSGTSKINLSGAATVFITARAEDLITAATLAGTIFNVFEYGALGDGSTNDYAAIQAAIDAAEVGGGTVFFPPGTYNVGSRLQVESSNVRLKGSGRGISTIVRTTSGSCLYIQGSFSTPSNNDLASNADQGDTSVTLASGGGSGFSADDWGLLIDEAVIPDSTSMKQAQFIQVRSVSTDTLNLVSPIADYNFTTANSAQVRLLNMLEGIKVSDLSFANSTPTSANDHLVSCFYLNAPIFENLEFYDSNRSGLQFFFCVNAKADVYVHDLLSDSGLSYHGYGVAEAAANLGGNFNINANRVRHAYTTVDSATFAYGVATGSVVRGNATDCEQANWDVHPPAQRILFSGVVANGSRHAGIQLRGKQCSVIGALIAGTLGPAVYVTSTAADTDVCDVIAEGTNQGTDNDSMDWTEEGSFYDRGVRTKVRGFRTSNCGGPGMEPTTDCEDWDYSDIHIIDPCRITTTNKDGIKAVEATSTSGRINRAIISCSDTRMDYGIRATSANLDLLVTYVESSGHQTSALNLNAVHKQFFNGNPSVFDTRAWYVLDQSAVAASHTGDTNETTLATVTIPAGVMGANGRVRVLTHWTVTNSGNTKSLRVDFGGTNYLNRNETAVVQGHYYTEVRNRNSESSQIGTGSIPGGFGTTSASAPTSSVDTSSAVTLTITGQLANSGETITLESYSVEILYGE